MSQTCFSCLRSSLNSWRINGRQWWWSAAETVSLFEPMTAPVVSHYRPCWRMIMYLSPIRFHHTVNMFNLHSWARQLKIMIDPLPNGTQCGSNIPECGVHRIYVRPDPNASSGDKHKHNYIFFWTLVVTEGILRNMLRLMDTDNVIRRS